MDDADTLLSRAKRGDDAALAALCHKMRPRLFRTAYAVLKDRDEADDVAQDALVRALTKRFTFLAKGSAEGWMSRIALNLAKNRYRDKGRRGELLHEHRAHLERGAQASAPPAADGVLADKERAARLEAALAQLGNRQRDVIALRLFGGLTFKEIAETLGITEANARVAGNTAQKKLTALVADGAPEVTP